MDNNCCEYFSRCSIFNEILKGNDLLIDTYKNLYCNNGNIGKKRCVRYNVINEIGTCPSNILPNSSKNIEEIIRFEKV